MIAPLPAIIEPFAPRPVRYLGIWREHDWAIKGYGIHHPLYHAPDAEEFALTRPLQFAALRGLPLTLHAHGQAFGILHEGREGAFLVLCWWGGENMLYRRVWLKVRGDGHFDEISHTHVVACVWELSVIQHERNAWVRHVLGNTPPNPEAYLYDTLLD